MLPSWFRPCSQYCCPVHSWRPINKALRYLMRTHWSSFGLKSYSTPQYWIGPDALRGSHTPFNCFLMLRPITSARRNVLIPKFVSRHFRLYVLLLSWVFPEPITPCVKYLLYIYAHIISTLRINLSFTKSWNGLLAVSVWYSLTISVAWSSYLVGLTKNKL